jgi:hypothetical protein
MKEFGHQFMTSGLSGLRIGFFGSTVQPLSTVELRVFGKLFANISKGKKEEKEKR